MSVYFRKQRGTWRYDFMVEGVRYAAGFTTKRAATDAQSLRRKEIQQETDPPIDMGFLELCNRRLDHVQAHNGEKHYRDTQSLAKRWIGQWGDLTCEEITRDMVADYILHRTGGVSAVRANRDLGCLRTLFNFGCKQQWIRCNPTKDLDFLPEERRSRYIPPQEDIERVLAVSDREKRDYLTAIRESLARSIEVNRLTRESVDFKRRLVTFHTRKKRGGHLTPRQVPMTQGLLQVLSRRFRERDKSKPWVFWHQYRSSKTGEQKSGPYGERKRMMKTLCKKAGVRYFRFHPLRHAGATLLEQAGVPIGSIQRLLGHESRLTTEIYLHSLTESERDAMRVFERETNRLREEFTHQSTHTGGRRFRVIAGGA